MLKLLIKILKKNYKINVFLIYLLLIIDMKKLFIIFRFILKLNRQSFRLLLIV